MFTLKKLMTVAAAFLCQVAIAQPLAQRQMEGAKYFDGSAAAQAPAQAELTEGEWVSMGKGRWRDDFVTRIFNVECLEWDVEVLKNEAYPGVYRVKAPYLDYAYTSQQEIDPESYVDFHAEDPLRVYFTAYNTGLDLDGNGALCINSIAGYKVTELGVETGLVAAANEGACGEMQDGEILFPQASLLVKYEDSPNDQWMYANLNFGGYKTGFRLLLPNAPDLELNIDLVGVNDAKDKMTVHFEVGKDCEKVRVAMLPGKANNDDWKALLEGCSLRLRGRRRLYLLRHTLPQRHQPPRHMAHKGTYLPEPRMEKTRTMPVYRGIPCRHGAGSGFRSGTCYLRRRHRGEHRESRILPPH